MKLFSTPLVIISFLGVILLGVGVYSVGNVGARDYRPLESIHGISYPIVNERTVVLEKLAHTDVYLQSSVFAKELQLTAIFDPVHITELAVGVRENSFWLSYPKTVLWSEGDDIGQQTRTVTIPLTDAMQDSDQSVDIMFFAKTNTATNAVDEGIHDSTHWELISLETTVSSTTPTFAEIKNFGRSIVNRERPL